MKRRDFFKSGGAALLGLALPPPLSDSAKDVVAEVLPALVLDVNKSYTMGGLPYFIRHYGGKVQHVEGIGWSASYIVPERLTFGQLNEIMRQAYGSPTRYSEGVDYEQETAEEKGDPCGAAVSGAVESANAESDGDGEETTNLRA